MGFWGAPILIFDLLSLIFDPGAATIDYLLSLRDGGCAGFALLPLVDGEAAIHVAEALDGDLDIAFTEQAFEFFSPLDQQDIAFPADEVVEPKRLQLAQRLDAVEIDVEEAALGTAILVDKRESWTGNVFLLGGLEGFGDSLHHGGFAASEIAAEQHDSGVAQQRSERAAQLDGLFRGMGEKLFLHQADL